jgi:3-phosphoshikimate 1-carboxyvinyltransferase
MDCLLTLEVAGVWQHFVDDAQEVRGPRSVRGIRENARHMPDGAMSLAIVAAAASSETKLTGLHTLRVKETDRIAALANELTKVGCEVTTTDDSITIIPIPRDEQGNFTRSEPVVIDTYNDHRMAMAFAVLGLVREGISIRNPACVRKSYPTFWRDFATLYQ